jgi:HK97 family phage portal protein
MAELAAGEFDAGMVGPGELKFALSQTLPVRWSGRPMWSQWDVETAIEKGLKASTWVYVCIMRNTNALASLPWEVQVQQADGRWVSVPGHPLQMLIDRPNPYWSRQRLMSLIVMELLLAGNSLVCKVRLKGGEFPVNIFTVRPNRIAPIPSKDIGALGYEVQSQDGTRYFIGRKDVAHIQLPDPGNHYWGLSPLKAASKAIDVDREAASWQKSTLANMLIPPGMFTITGGAALTSEQFTEQQEILKKRYQGALNARSPLLLGGDVKWTELSQSAKDLDFMEGRRMSREEICAILGVPPPVAGILERATYSNMGVARQIWWEDTLLPLLELISTTLTNQLASEWGTNVRLMPVLSGVPALLEDFSRRVGISKELWAMGVPFNQASDRLSLGMQVPGGDIGYIPANLQPVVDGQGPMGFEDMLGQGLDDEGTKAGRVAQFHKWLGR